jgi:dTDP-4-amino-4,6-dideoxygalactose transaminase
MARLRTRSRVHNEVELVERALRAVRDAEPIAQPLTFAAPDINDDDIAAVTRVLRSGWLTTGEESIALEQELASYLDAPYVVAMSSCTAALEVAIRCLDLDPGARVGVPAWTFVATATSVVHAGATPVILDVDADTLNLSPDSLAVALEMGLDAVIPVHFGGVPVPREIHELCASRNVAVIEDAAHALGAHDHRGRVRGQGSVAACLSFYATKNLTCGEGGALVTDRIDIAERALALRLHGLTRDAWARYRPGGPSDYGLLEPGLKANLPDLLAALARSQLLRFDELQGRRRRLVIQYRKLLAAIPGVRCVPGHIAVDGADHLMVIVLPEGADRALVQARLRDEGVPTSVHFPPLHHFEWFRVHGELVASGLPSADSMAARVLSLPLHPGMNPFDVDRVIGALWNALM